jgi:hypothetical protein
LRLATATRTWRSKQQDRSIWHQRRHYPAEQRLISLSGLIKCGRIAPDRMPIVRDNRLIAVRTFRCRKDQRWEHRDVRISSYGHPAR